MARNRSASRIGSARRRLTLEQPVLIADDAGGWATTHQPVALVWAQLLWRGGEERRLAGRPEQAARHEVSFRWRAGVTAGMRLIGADMTLGIVSAGDPDGTRRRLVCLCEEIKP
ncbi:MAG: phage head closure protein [Bosea sp.]|jgi:SPP1 family predicted phage head-tail adaptor|nr:phage head closure protein [Bosea sp. (in: a-proteobacteria)]